MQFLLNSGIGPVTLMNILEDCITPYLFHFNLIKNKSFQFGALLEMPCSSPSMEKFSLDIQK